MTGASKLFGRLPWSLPVSLLAAALLALWVGLHTKRPAAGPLDDWDIPRLVYHLNGAGLGLCVIPTQKDGLLGQTAFLTTTDKGWDDLNRLPKGPEHIRRWRGTLYCERGPGGDDWADLAGQWGDCCLVVGPFLLYGDRELLGRVRAALADLLPS